MLAHPGKRVQTTRLNMTPMIDCVFLLLTFFMVVSELSRQYDAVEVKLPRVSASTVPEPTAFVIKVTSDGAIYVAGERVSLDRLEDILVRLSRLEPGTAFVIKADEGVEFRHIRAILGLCTRRHIRIWSPGFGVRASADDTAPAPPRRHVEEDVQ